MMSEWWSYAPSDFLMFSPRTYYRLFALYNRDTWPLPLIAVALGFGALGVRLSPPAWAGRTAAAVLALAWAWTAWGYFHIRFATIHWAADWMTAAFAVEAALLVATAGLGRPDLQRAGSSAAGALLVTVALGYPLIDLALGRPLAQAQVVGLAPDPTAIATLGLLAMARRPPWGLLAIPIGWCAFTGMTLATMQAPDAYVAPTAAILAAALAAARRTRGGADDAG